MHQSIPSVTTPTPPPSPPPPAGYLSGICHFVLGKLRKCPTVGPDPTVGLKIGCKCNDAKTAFPSK